MKQSLSPAGREVLTSEALKQHTIRQSKSSRSPTPTRAQQPHETPNPRQNGENDVLLGNWKTSQDFSAGATRLLLEDYSGLAVGDTLELSPGTTAAEVVTIVGFGSLLIAAPTRFSHAAGTGIRRLLEGNGERWQVPRSGIGATASSRPPPNSMSMTSDAGFEDRASWSPREREHQLTRYRRKRRELRMAEAEQIRQPGLVVSVRPPEKMVSWHGQLSRR